MSYKTVINCHANMLTTLCRHKTVSHIQCYTATYVKCTDTTAQHLSKPARATQLPKLFTHYDSTSLTEDNAGHLKHAALGDLATWITAYANWRPHRPHKGQDPPRFQIHAHEAIIQPTKTANLDTELTSQLQTSDSLELIKRNTVTICKQIMLRCMRSQHLNTCIL